MNKGFKTYTECCDYIARLEKIINDKMFTLMSVREQKKYTDLYKLLINVRNNFEKHHHTDGVLNK